MHKLRPIVKGEQDDDEVARLGMPSASFYPPADGELAFHRFAAIVPRAENDQFQAMCRDIAQNGLLEPIVIYQRKILDGRERYLSCEKLQLPARYVEYDGDDKGAWQLLLSRNVYRKHLSESQRAMIAARMATMPLGSNQHVAKGVPIGAACKLTNSSRRSVARARQVLSRGDASLVSAVDQGLIAVSDAAQRIKAETANSHHPKRVERRERPPLSGTPFRRTLEIELHENQLADLLALEEDQSANLEFRLECTDAKWKIFVATRLVIKSYKKNAHPSWNQKASQPEQLAIPVACGD